MERSKVNMTPNVLIETVDRNFISKTWIMRRKKNNRDLFSLQESFKFCLLPPSLPAPSHSSVSA